LTSGRARHSQRVATGVSRQAMQKMSRRWRPARRTLVAVQSEDHDGGREAEGRDHDGDRNLPDRPISYPVRAVRVALVARQGTLRVAVVVPVQGQVCGGNATNGDSSP
jgi:hypothetical protein